MRSPRGNRVPERIKQILAEEVGRLKDPRIGFVTVTDVRVTPDLLHVTAFYTVLPQGGQLGEGGEGAAEQERARTAEGLASALPVLRRALGSRLRLSQVPTVEFQYDPVPDQAQRIEHLLREVRRDQ